MPRPVSVTRSFATATVPRLATTPVAITRQAYRVPAAPPPSNAPGPAYLRHHDIIAPQVDSAAFRHGWRVLTRLDGLLEAGRIDREHWDYANEWRRWFETMTPCGQQPWDARVQSSGVPDDAGMLRRVTAASRLRAAAKALGDLRVRLLEACVVRDRAWREIAMLLRVSDKTATGWVIEALEALADWRAGRPVGPPPELRYRRNGAGAS
jgi:hypothetical protein